MKFRKKPIVIEATQWFKNGDHPQDACYTVTPDSHSTSQFAPFLSEGKVVRNFRHPEVPGNAPCKHCGVRMHDHGWIDTLEGNHIVCPGDWIITGVMGEHYPCKPDIFAATYEPADAAPAAPSPCIGNDPACPCQDGDICHYVDGNGVKAMPIPAARKPTDVVEALRSVMAWVDNWEPAWVNDPEWLPTAERARAALAAADQEGK